MTARIQNLLILVGIVLIGGLGYYLYTTNSESLLQESATDNQAAAESAMLVRRLNLIKDVSFEATLFSDPAFTSLVDFSEPINQTSYGKLNPFVGI